MRPGPVKWSAVAASCVVAGFIAPAVFVSCAPDPGYREGQYVIECELQRTGWFDPIVYPGQTFVGHRHEFYGGNINPNSTSEQLSSDPATTCAADGEPSDRASYWHPTVLINGFRAPLTDFRVYYTEGRKHNAEIQDLPRGLKMIGDRHDWGCGAMSGLSGQPSPPQCPSTSDGLSFHVYLPSCWNGRDLDSSDHRSHMAYPLQRDADDARECPDSHPVPLPAVIYRGKTGRWPAPSQVSLSSGAPNTMHADYFDGWAGNRQTVLNDACIRGTDADGPTKCTGADRAALPQ